VPVDHIKSSALQSTSGAHHFTRMEAGGKVEFALDALFNITEHVPVDGDGGNEDSKSRLKRIRPRRSMVHSTLLLHVCKSRRGSLKDRGPA
jgi:hypothetical protein